MKSRDAQPETWYAGPIAEAFSAAPLNGDVDVDVVVVGAGLAGLNTAVGLNERGVRNVAIVEAQRVGFGASGRNGGFVFGGYSLDPRKLVQQAGQEQARTLYGWTRQGVELIRQRAREWQIDCEIVEGGVLWADWFHDRSHLQNVRKWLAQTLDVHWLFIDRAELRRRIHSPRYGDGLLEPEAFHFNPLRYAQGLAARLVQRGGQIFEHSPVLGIERTQHGWRLRSADGALNCGQVVIATGAYGPALPVQRCISPIATYVMVTEPLHERAAQVLDASWAVYDTRFAFDYYRLLPDTRLLWGGRISIRNPAPHILERRLRRDLQRVFPQLQNVAIDYRWSGLMSYARHQMPVLGQSAPGLWHAIGFGGHGMAPTTVAGEVMAEALTGDERRLQAFSHWPAASACGMPGRWAAQAIYWWKQAADGLRAGKTRAVRRYN